MYIFVFPLFYNIINFSGGDIGVPLGQHSLHVVGQFALEHHLAARRGVDETQRAGVQSLTRQQREAIFDELLVFVECGALQYAVAA